MSFSGIFIKMSLTIFTLNIIIRNLCRYGFGKWSTGFNRSCYLPGLSNGSNKFIVSFSPVTRVFFLRIILRLGSFFVELKSNIEFSLLKENENLCCFLRRRVRNIGVRCTLFAGIEHFSRLFLSGFLTNRLMFTLEDRSKEDEILETCFSSLPEIQH